MGAYANLDAGIAGSIFGIDHDIESGVAGEEIPFGVPVFGHPGVADVVWKAHQDEATMTLDADLVASNVLTSTVNDIEVATTYGTSHAATMTAHIAALNAKAELVALGITFVAGSTNRKIVARSKGRDTVYTAAVTAGSSQAGATTAYTTWAKFLGISMFCQKSSGSVGAGSNLYEIKDTVNIMSRGKIFVSCASSVLEKAKAYIVYLAGATQGIINSTATNNYDCGCYFRSNESGNLAILEVKGIN